MHWLLRERSGCVPYVMIVSMKDNEQESEPQVLSIGPGVIAVKADQVRVKAQAWTTSEGFEPHRCTQCKMKFYLGHHMAFPPNSPVEHYYSELQSYLDQDHKDSDEHNDYYYVED